MFENGLLSSFVPETLMVLAYLFCFIAPGLKTDKYTLENPTNKIYVASVQSNTVPVNGHNLKNFFSENKISEQTTRLIIILKEIRSLVFYEPIVYISNDLNKVCFSRPPPII